MILSYPWYIGDWRMSRARSRMNSEQKGIYRELLDQLYYDGNLPTNEQELMQITGATAREWRRSWPVIREQFYERDGRLYQLKTDEVRPRVETWHDQRRQAGKASGEARRKSASTRTEKGTAVERTLNERIEPYSSSSSSSTTSVQENRGGGESSVPSPPPKPLARKSPPPLIPIRETGITPALLRPVLFDCLEACGVELPPPDDAMCRRIVAVDRLTAEDLPALREFLIAKARAGMRPKSWALVETVVGAEFALYRETRAEKQPCGKCDGTGMLGPSVPCDCEMGKACAVAMEQNARATAELRRIGNPEDLAWLESLHG